MARAGRIISAIETIRAAQPAPAERDAHRSPGASAHEGGQAMSAIQINTFRNLTRAALLAGSALVATPALAQTSGTQLEEVVVTAQKRAQNLQDVPISVTAITQEVLKANRI